MESRVEGFPGDQWATLYSTKSYPFEPPSSGDQAAFPNRGDDDDQFVIPTPSEESLASMFANIAASNSD